MIIRFHKKFEKKFVKLSPKLKAAFKKRRDIFIINPHDPVLNNHPLRGEYSKYRSINITGDIRAIYEQIDKTTILFITIGTHAELYE